jgi:tetratricopeptide (TPR) repeat protein
MAMTKIRKLLPLLMLSMGSASLNAQNISISAPGNESDREIPPEPVQEGQIVPVAEEGIDQGIDDPDDMSVREATEIDALASEFALFKQLMADRVFDEADTVAKRVVELAIRTKGAKSNELAKALTNLAIVQHQTAEYEAAQQNFEAAIEIIEDNEDRLNAQLVNPLKGLGAAQLEGGRPDLALLTFNRAVHVTHVNEGPHNLDQIELLESLAETSVRMGEVDDAREFQDTIYALNVRKHSIDQLGLVPSLMRRAAWQHRAGFIFDERTTYRRVIRIIETNEDKNDLALIEPLLKLGTSYFFVDTSGTEGYQETRMTTGEIYFKRAYKIAKENPESDWQVNVQTSLALGDYYMHVGNSNRGQQAYLDVWNLLSENEDPTRLDVRREQLESIVPLNKHNLPEYVDPDDANAKAGLQSDDPLLRGSITITYDISARGRTANLKMIDASPPEFENMHRTVQRALRQRIYRPRFENAVPVATPDQTLAHTFYYRQSDLDAIKAAEAAKK